LQIIVFECHVALQEQISNIFQNNIFADIAVARSSTRTS